MFFYFEWEIFVKFVRSIYLYAFVDTDATNVIFDFRIPREKLNFCNLKGGGEWILEHTERPIARANNERQIYSN